MLIFARLNSTEGSWIASMDSQESSLTVRGMGWMDLGSLPIGSNGTISVNVKFYRSDELSVAPTDAVWGVTLSADMGIDFPGAWSPSGFTFNTNDPPQDVPVSGGIVLPDLDPSPVGTYGDSTHVAKITVNAKGLLTSVSEVAIATGIGAPAIITGFTVCANETELRSAVNAVAVKSGGGGILRLAPGSIQINSTLMIPVTDQGDLGMYFDFGRCPMISGITDGVTPLFQVAGAVKHMLFENLVIFGGGFATPGCGDGIQIMSSGGPELLNRFNGLAVSWCGGHGINVIGDDYEMLFDAPDCKNNKGSGMCFQTPTGGVISNIRVLCPDLSRNNRFGAEVLNYAQSIDLPSGGSVINNWLGGWQGPLRLAVGVNGENTGPALFDFSGGLPYIATLIACNLTSDMGTAQNPSLVSTMLVKYPGTNGDGKLNVIGCYTTPEGSATAAQLSLIHV